MIPKKQILHNGEPIINPEYVEYLEEKLKEGQTTYVAVRPNGTVSGPIGEETFVKTSLVMGYANTVKMEVKSETDAAMIWMKLLAMGYTIWKCNVRLLEEKTGERANDNNG